MRKSSFADNLLRHNLPDIPGFRCWGFQAGMLFNAMNAWWGGRDRRTTPHEGLDLCFYLDGEGEPHALRGGFRVPAVYEGQVVRIDDDFLGKSIYVRHAFRNDGGHLLFSVYGHTRPAAGIDVDLAIEEGDIIANVADISSKATAPPPHLHLSIIWVPPSLSVANLTWATISQHKEIELIDPLGFLGLPYVLVP